MIQDMLYVGEKTIATDLKKLQGKGEDPLEVLGQKLIEQKKTKGRVSIISGYHGTDRGGLGWSYVGMFNNLSKSGDIIKSKVVD